MCTASFGGAETSASVYNGVSAPPTEAGGGEGLRAIDMLPLWGKEVLPILEQSLSFFEASLHFSELVCWRLRAASHALAASVQGLKEGWETEDDIVSMKSRAMI